MTFITGIEMYWQGEEWCYLTADSMGELHVFALRLGLEKSWFRDTPQRPYYEIPVKMKEKALKFGVVLLVDYLGGCG